MGLKLAVGDLAIHRIIEQETTFLPATELLPGLTPERPRGEQAMDATGRRARCARCFDPVLSVLFVKTPHHTILIDSCIGNDKPRPHAPEVEHENQRHLYARTGERGDFGREIDFVMCTHLHVDHVGWNTRLEGGRWVPTFPTRATSSARPNSTTRRSRAPRPSAASPTAYCRWSRPDAPISCATTMRSAITFASCRRRVTRPDTLHSPWAVARMTRFSAAI